MWKDLINFCIDYKNGDIIVQRKPFHRWVYFKDFPPYN